MAAYDSYKDSGVKWLGKVPSHWEITKMRAHFSERKQFSKFGKETLLSVSEYSGITPSINEDGENISRSESLEGYKICNESDLVINIMLAWKRGLGISLFNGIVSPAYCVFETHNINPSYANYLLRTDTFIAEFKRKSTGIIESRLRLYPSEFKNIQCLCPPREEQEAIVSYLDNVTAKIDEAIEAQQKMIDALNERKQIIITRAVTKGLNPDAPLRDSGNIEYGYIPSHWRIYKTRYALQMPITDGPHETPELFPDGIPFISAEAISKGHIDFNLMRGFISENFYKACCKKYVPKKFDVYMIKSGATTGKTAIVETDETFTIWSPIAVFRCDYNRILPYYLLNFLRSTPYLKIIEQNWSFGTQQNIGMRVLERLPLVVPPIKEQEEILKYITLHTNPIEKSISNCERMISLLQERKQIIINEVVTGKKKVI